MNKVYIVTCDNYSDYRIEKVFSSKRKAEEWIKIRTKVEKRDCGWVCGEDSEDYNIEEYEVDEKEKELKFKDWIIISGNINETPTPRIYRQYEGEESYCYYDNEIVYTRDWDEGKTIQEYGKGKITSEKLYICRELNSNLSDEENENKMIKIFQDTVKRLNYIQKVLNIFSVEDINKMLNGG